ncbi:4-(cytidine 5'-diphospho)-2-C-methyl-D-erythritol kinase [Desulfoluna spongiiphila]|uniref:4-diphosphocytidyl-2-C-methyl-D-erythritol kinase n=1 Tax=Desulfoluna spongiiphila TaxID=419481 RepID=A0A1G5GFL4_9BACT|nr:4-(cytidine 5'-diphospho)-2-C-methyl-D-erythritol kinase [Desulfoluna spongiiphila]SCY50335.1 4-diphosphocytidyl-2-C-methyl-D-erythritol kinase [Desulfoluna spongiiphila]VVS93586.1 4-diphosphocytidyl-2c-methyl-d-erythritol kinase [Desulfoluna spongiiphila]
MELKSPAKVNLFLHVTGRRENGYHDLCSLMCGVGLYDRIVIEPADTGISLSCDYPGVPEDETNLAWRAAALFFEAAGLAGGCRIAIDKRIPPGAGLGGGSGNAATVLKGLNSLYGRPFDEASLESMALKLGADVPFFIRCTPVLATGVGECFEVLPAIKPYHLLIIYPGTGLSTAEVYKNLKLGLTKSQKKIKSRLLNEGVIDPLHHLHNDLEPPAQMLSPAVGDARKALELAGADGVLMSGSGSSVFGLFREPQGAQAGETLLMCLREEKPEQYAGWQLFLAELLLTF